MKPPMIAVWLGMIALRVFVALMAAGMIGCRKVPFAQPPKAPAAGAAVRGDAETGAAGPAKIPP